jgi:GNAT superfamily N-acetyltransferase
MHPTSAIRQHPTQWIPREQNACQPAWRRIRSGSPMTGEVTVRPIDFARDSAPLMSFLNERDTQRLLHSEVACDAGDCFIFVADEDGTAVGWAVVHTSFREDQDWSPPDEDTRAFQSGDNAYLENIEVTARHRSSGLGRKLIIVAQDEARRRGKKHLWLHTAENNSKAHALFDREGWVHERSVYPPWKPSSRTRIYRKDI